MSAIESTLCRIACESDSESDSRSSCSLRGTTWIRRPLGLPLASIPWRLLDHQHDHRPSPWNQSCSSTPVVIHAYLAYSALSFCHRKSLKVVDLKDILTKAEVAIGKANKPDLIAKILASPQALKVYEQQFGSPSVQNASATPAPVSTKPASTVQVSSCCTCRGHYSHAVAKDYHRATSVSN